MARSCNPAIFLHQVRELASRSFEMAEPMPVRARTSSVPFDANARWWLAIRYHAVIRVGQPWHQAERRHSHNHLLPSLRVAGRDHTPTEGVAGGGGGDDMF